MGRPRVKIDLVELIRQLRRAGLWWRTIARRYYSQTRQDISWMTLKTRRCSKAVAARGEPRWCWVRDNALCSWHRVSIGGTTRDFDYIFSLSI